MRKLLVNPTPVRPRFSMVAAVMVAVAIWCGLIAIGVFNQTGGNWVKSAIVIAVAVAFLGGWSVALKRRSTGRRRRSLTRAQDRT